MTFFGGAKEGKAGWRFAPSPRVARGSCSASDLCRPLRDRFPSRGDWGSDECFLLRGSHSARRLAATCSGQTLCVVENQRRLVLRTNSPRDARGVLRLRFAPLRMTLFWWCDGKAKAVGASHPISLPLVGGSRSTRRLAATCSGQALRLRFAPLRMTLFWWCDGKAKAVGASHQFPSRWSGGPSAALRSAQDDRGWGCSLSVKGTLVGTTEFATSLTGETKSGWCFAPISLAMLGGSRSTRRLAATCSGQALRLRCAPLRMTAY